MVFWIFFIIQQKYKTIEDKIKLEVNYVSNMPSPLLYYGHHAYYVWEREVCYKWYSRNKITGYCPNMKTKIHRLQYKFGITDNRSYWWTCYFFIFLISLDLFCFSCHLLFLSLILFQLVVIFYLIYQFLKVFWQIFPSCHIIF